MNPYPPSLFGWISHANCFSNLVPAGMAAEAMVGLRHQLFASLVVAVQSDVQAWGVLEKRSSGGGPAAASERVDMDF